MTKKCTYDRVAPGLLECRVCHRRMHTDMEPSRVHTHCGHGPKAPEKTHASHRRDVANLAASSCEMARRVAICECCFQFNGYQCRAICVSCSGYAKWKRAVREGTCPEGRWSL